jgi:hypothetical protein
MTLLIIIFLILKLRKQIYLLYLFFKKESIELFTRFRGADTRS